MPKSGKLPLRQTAIQTRWPHHEHRSRDKLYRSCHQSDRTGADGHKFQRRSDPWISKKTSARRNAEVFFYFQAAARADGAGRVLFFWSNGFALRAGAPAAWGRFFLSVKWLCAPRGPEAGLVFSLSWFSRWWRGAGFFFRSNGFALRAGQR